MIISKNIFKTPLNHGTRRGAPLVFSLLGTCSLLFISLCLLVYHQNALSRKEMKLGELLGISLISYDGFWGERLNWFHNVFVILILVNIIFATITSYQTLYTIEERNFNLKHHFGVEFLWTLLPTLTLLCIGAPSLGILYGMEDPSSTVSIDLKTMGYQWFWTYHLLREGEEDGLVESYMERLDEGRTNAYLRREGVVNLPPFLGIRNIVSSGDVIHSWALPPIGLKVDAIPGRLNILNFLLEEQGIFYGQCRELCGVNHRFMPIIVSSM